MKKSIKCLLLTLSPITISCTTGLASCGKTTPDEPIPVVHTSKYYKPAAIADTITVFDVSQFEDLQDDMRTTLQSLEGIVAQTTAQFFVMSGNVQRDRWLYDMQSEYHFDIKKLSNPDDIWAKIKECADSGLLESYVKYNKASKTGDGRNDISINNAAIVAACDHSLMISNDLYNQYSTEIDGLGLDEAEWSAIDNTAYDTFGRYKENLNKTMILNQDPLEFNLRDYAIASKIPTICIGLLDDEQKKEISDAMDDNAPMFGWSYGFGNEQDYLIWATQNKLPVVASDHDANLSLYSYKKVDFAYKQTKRKKLIADPRKHYVTIVMSDGDNIQWMQDDFLSSKEYWGSPYRGQIPITWTISPSVIDLNASILDELYKTATDNDQLIAGPSGFTYINPAWYYQDNLKEQYNEFVKITADYMKDCDLEYVNPLDFQCPQGGAVPDYKCLKPFMDQEQVKGLVWAVTQLSLSGHGSIDWINNKPILSFREGFWDNAGSTIYDVANRINNEYPRDIHSINGYTAITSCVWAQNGKMYNIEKFKRLLKKDVEIVTLDQLLQLITDYVPHKSDVPKKYSPIG